MSASKRTAAFASVRVRAPRADAERAAAELWAAGASGLEEGDAGEDTWLIVYAPAAHIEAVRAAATAVLGAGAVAPAEPVPDVDWPATWKQGLRPIVVSARLVVRPPFAAHALGPGQGEIVIEPRQAFGTGAHASTALALEALDAVLARSPATRVLDVGCGSGVLALAALRLGAGRAVACDLDPLAAVETRENATANGLAGRLDVFVGSLAALGGCAFELVVANLIRSELVPLLPDLAVRLCPGGALVVSGLLAAERAELEASLAACGARVLEARMRLDERGDHWLALIATR